MASIPRILAVMGSGETAPTMVSTHQALFARLPPKAPAVLVETPYGFQENADEISTRTAEYFERNVGHTIRPIGPRRAGTADDATIARLQAAQYVFAGPGSPTYALDVWRGSAFVDEVAAKLRAGGVVVFASAAAVGLGRWAVPVYEIYKVGQRPHWVEGLNLLAAAGVEAAVIPHFDNAEGGTHDTRFCYLGASRLAHMERDLGSDTFVIGVDEHTALLIDLGDGTAAVRGRGVVTIRRAGETLQILPAGHEVPLDALVRGRGGQPPVPPAADGDGDTSEDPTIGTTSTLGEQVTAATTAFDQAVDRRDAGAATTAILTLEEAVAAWSADTTQTDETDRARAALRALIVRLGVAAADGLVDPTTRMAPLMDVVVRTREQLRERREYALADELRVAADAVGVELRDAPDGTTWRVVSG